MFRCITRLLCAGGEVKCCAVAASIVWLLPIGIAHGNETATPPRWIWSGDNTVDACRFVRLWRADVAISAAKLQFAADFCRATVEINGQPVLSVAPYVQAQTLDVTNWLHRGDNEIVVRAERVPGPPAVALSLEVTRPDGRIERIVSDADWQIDHNKSVDLGEVPPQFWGLGRRGIEVSAFENYEQWQQAKTDSKRPQAPRFWTAPGFEVTELRTARPEEGSWIAMAFDLQGRMLISREDAGFLRMTLGAERKTVAHVEPIVTAHQECRGLLFANGWCYANANNSKGVYRFRIDDAGVHDNVHLREFPGNVGHGRNDLALDFGEGALRRLYSIHGDSVDVPRSGIVDLTSPLNESYTRSPKREGVLLRTNLDGQQWELVCGGLRNPYGVAIHAGGDPFTFDADNEFDMGTPWYRPTRILHLMTGGDSGYREVTGALPPRFHDQPDHAPPLLDIGRSSPTSVMFGYDLAFPEPYRQALFALDWTYGRVLAIHLSMRGASWRAAPELFLQGRPLNVTDVAAGPDGAMYLITGGRKTQSALYRVSFVGASSSVMPSTGAHEFAAQLFSKIAPRGPSTTDLADPDPVLRHAARIALERRPLKEWRTELLQRSPSPAALWGLLALARARQANDVPVILDRLLAYRVEQLDLGSQFVWLRLCGLCRETAAEAVQPRSSELVSHLLALWTSLDDTPALSVCPEGTSVELRRRVTYLLGDLSTKGLPALAVPRLLDSRVQEDQIAGLLALRSIRDGWTAALRRRQFEVLNDMPRMIGGQGLPATEKWLRTETLKTLSPDEQAALADVLQPAPVVSEPLPPPRPVVQKWTLADLEELYESATALGDAARGQAVFRDALCVRCHRVGLRGAAVGPELTQVSRRFSRRDMLESILSPSLSVAENYRLEAIVTDSGQTFTGRVVHEGDYRSERLKLATDPLRPEVVVEIDKKDITEHRTTPTSPMPQGLLDSFTLAEIRDLLIYLERGLAD